MFFPSYTTGNASARARMLAYSLLVNYASYTLSVGGVKITAAEVSEAMRDMASGFYVETMCALCEQFLALHPERMHEVSVQYILRTLMRELSNTGAVSEHGKLTQENNELANLCRSIAATSETFADELAEVLAGYEVMA